MSETPDLDIPVAAVGEGASQAPTAGTSRDMVTALYQPPAPEPVATPEGDGPGLPQMSAEDYGAMQTGGATGNAAKLIAEARKFLGTPYKWGGTSPLGFDCVAEGTLVSAPLGPVAIEDIKFGTLVWTHAGAAHVTALVDKGEQDALRIVTRNRELVVTPGHKVRVVRKAARARCEELWVRADEIEAGDHLVILGERPDVEGPEPIGVDEAWLWGVYLGDGSINQGKRLHFASFHKERARVEEILVDLGYRPRFHPTHGVTVHSVALAALAAEEIGTGSAGKRVPEWVWRSGTDVRRAFLDGYIAADGHIPARRADGTSLHSINRRMLDDVRLLAIELGLNVGRVSTLERTETNYANAKTIYSFRIYPGRLRHPYLVRHWTPGAGHLGATKILRVEPAGRARMWDIEVEGDHTFFADGALVSNCSGLLQYVYRSVGIELPRVSYQQANYGKRISMDQAKPGDIVAWDTSSRNNGADHIAIFIGNGQVLHAPKPGDSVKISKVWGNPWAVQMNL